MAVNFTKTDLMNNDDYQTDTEPMKNLFPSIENISAAYWKAGRHRGYTRIGPADSWLKGFIVLDYSDYIKIESEYEWNEVKIKFEDDINPYITGFSGFLWYSSNDFSKAMTRNIYMMGDFYLDKANKILYFNLNTY